MDIQDILYKVITGLTILYTFFDPPKLELSACGTGAYTMCIMLLCIIFTKIQDANIFVKAIVYIFFLACCFILLKDIWKQNKKKILPYFYPYWLCFCEFLREHKKAVIVFCSILVDLMLIAVVLVIMNAKLHIFQKGGSGKPTEETLQQNVQVSENRMRAMGHLSINAESRWEDETFWNQDKIMRKDVTSVKFSQNIRDIEEVGDQLNSFSWDVSAKSDHTVIACFFDGTLWVAADGIIQLSEDSSYLFAGFSNLEKIDFNRSVDTSYTTDMSNMFALCKTLNNLDLSELNTENVTNMFRMFYCCESMSDLNLSQMDTSQVTNMGNMFSYCTSFITIDVTNFSTGNVTDMGNMFYCCEKLESIDISHFETSSVELLNGMFYGCANLISIDVSNFKFSSIQGMCNVFYKSGISEIIVSDWPVLNEDACSNFMSPGSTINGIQWDEFSSDCLEAA